MKKVIVSFTSYPARIKYVSMVVKTLLIQTRKPDLIILWLAESQFPQKDDELPEDLKVLTEYSFEIRWCEDLKPHKKYFYAMQDFPNDVIVTVDDDVLYSPKLISELYKSYEQFPNAISCGVGHRIIIDKNNEISRYEKWVKNDKFFSGVPKMDIMAVGVGGVLYPPGILRKNVFDKKLIFDLCLYQDDLWLKVIEILEGIPTVEVGYSLPYPEFIEGTQEQGLYNCKNINANDVVLGKLSLFFDKEYHESNILVKKIISFDSSVSRQVINEDEKNECDIELIDLLKKGFYIYGAGIGASMVLECIHELDDSLNPISFVVTKKSAGEDTYYERPVVEISEAANGIKDKVIIISTAEAKHEEIKNTLSKYKTGQQLYIKDSVMGRILLSKQEIKVAQKMFSWSLLE